MGEATDLEPVAIALYESHVRAEKEIGLLRADDWLSLPVEDRDGWREKAKDVVREGREIDFRRDSGGW